MVRFVLLLFLAVVAISPACAEEPAKVTQTVQVYEGMLVFPPPVWVNSAADLDNIKVDREQKGNVFSLEQIPKDQEFGSWTRLHGVYGYRLPGYDMDRFFKESTQAFANGCKVQPKGKVYEGKNGNRVMFLICDELKEEWVVNGNNSEQAAVFFGQVGQSFVKVYQSFRGPAGTLDSEESIAAMREAFGRAKMIRYELAE